MANDTYAPPRVAPSAWRAPTPAGRLRGVLVRHGPVARDLLPSLTGDPESVTDALLNALIVSGEVESQGHLYAIKSCRERHEIQVTLHDGTTVGSWSPEWLRECEAQSVLTLPTRGARAAYVLRVRQRRGDAAANALESLVISIFRANKAAGRYE